MSIFFKISLIYHSNTKSRSLQSLLIIWCQYEQGNNNWIDYNNNKDEYTIAYYGLNNNLIDKNVNISELNVYANDIKN